MDQFSDQADEGPGEAVAGGSGELSHRDRLPGLLHILQDPRVRQFWTIENVGG